MDYNSIPISAEEALKYVQGTSGIMGGWRLCAFPEPDLVGVAFPYPVSDEKDTEKVLHCQLERWLNKKVEKPTEPTMRQYLEQTRDLWWWIANNPGKTKADWPGWMEMPMCSDCPLCTYSIKQVQENGGRLPAWSKEEKESRRSYASRCSYCPLKDKWGGEIRSDGSYICLDVDSPYERWTVAWALEDLPKQRIAAARLALLCEEVIEELDVGGKISAGDITSGRLIVGDIY